MNGGPVGFGVSARVCPEELEGNRLRLVMSHSLRPPLSWLKSRPDVS